MSEPIQPSNPYEAPTARLSDQASGGAAGDLIENGRKVPAGHGPRWLRRGWELFQVAPLAWIGMWLIYVVIVGVANFIPFLGWLIGLIVHPLLLGGLINACHAADQNQPVRVVALFSAFSTHPGPLALLGLLQFAAYVAVGLVLAIVAALVFGGAASMGMLREGAIGSAMVVPFGVFGIVGLALVILIVMANWFAPALVVLRGIGPLEALRMSFRACLKNIAPFLLYFLVLVGLAIVASVPLLLGWLVLAPVIFCSIYAAYRDLFVAEA